MVQSISVLPHTQSPLHMERSNVRDFQTLLKIIKVILRYSGQDMDTVYANDSILTVNPFIAGYIGCIAMYQIYLLHCMAQMQDLVLIGEIVWINALILLCCAMSFNYLRRQHSLLEMVGWFSELFHNHQPIALTREHIDIANDECLRTAKVVFG